MKMLMALFMSCLIIAVCVVVTDDLWAQTRTLVTTLYITVKPQQPSVAGAPESVATALTSPYVDSRNQQFIKVDMASMGSIGVPRYTMLERL